MPRAAGLADAIQAQFDIEPQLIKGKDGIFEIRLDGELVYSKAASGRFPEPGEAEGLLGAKLGG